MVTHQLQVERRKGKFAITIRRACGYLYSRRASPPIGRYQIILLGDGGIWVWTTCRRLLLASLASGARTHDHWVTSPMPPSLDYEVHHKAPFALEIHFEILFRNKNSEYFSFKSKHFHTGNKLSKANIGDTSFDVCKHWPTDHKWNFAEISQNRTCSKWRNKISKFISFESWLFALEIFLAKGTN